MEPLLAVIRAGRQRADELVTRYQACVYAVCRAIVHNDALAADAAQQAFLNLFTHAGGTAQLPADASAEAAFVRVVAQNAAKKLLMNSHTSAPVQRAPEPVAPQPNVLEAQEDAARLRTALRRLPEEQRSVVALQYFFSFSYSNIAEALLIELGTVKSRRAAALHRLRTVLQGSFRHGND